MGAPGVYVLCLDGHVNGVINEDLYWGEPEDESSEYKKLEKLENSRCKKCGKIAKYKFYHYGDINDCLDESFKLVWNSDEERYIIPETFKDNSQVKMMNVIKRNDECEISTINDEHIKKIIERLKSAHVLLIDADKIGNVKIPEIKEEVLINILRDCDF